jgi:hypothetical protein
MRWLTSYNEIGATAPTEHCLFEVGEAMLRSKLGRERSDLDAAEIATEIDSWLQRRPGRIQ